MINREYESVWKHQRLLANIIQKKTEVQRIDNGLQLSHTAQAQKESAVLFLLSHCPVSAKARFEPCLILTKRSPHVRQPGDLCCPGGSFWLRWDLIISLLLNLPYSPLKQWTGWPGWRRRYRPMVPKLRLLLTVALREAWEEMGLNPLKVQFWGPLPSQQLSLFDRVIHPMVGWVTTSPRFRPNWEVARLVYLPLSRLLDPERYGRFRPMIQLSSSHQPQALYDDYLPCFVHQDANGRELLWGATFRVVQDFLNRIFGFQPLPLDSLPVVQGMLDPGYPNGKGRLIH